MISMTREKNATIIRIPDAMLKPKAYEYDSRTGEKVAGVKYLDTARFGQVEIGKTDAGDPLLFGCVIRSVKGGKHTPAVTEFKGFSE